MAISSPQEQLFNNGSDFFNHLIADIQAANKTIELETYTFNKFHIGKRLGEALVEASKRGVRVRILVDGAGTPRWGGTFTHYLEKHGVHTKIFHPFPWGLWQWSRSVVKLPIALKLIYLLLKINSRNHKKVCMLDQKIAYIGSINIDYRHLKEADGGKGWRDTSVRLAHIDLSELCKAFEMVWEHVPVTKRIGHNVGHIFLPHHVNSVIRLNHTRHGRRALYKQLLRRIAKCKERIWITNAYFIPDNFLLKKIKEAAKKNIDVRILLPNKSDVSVMPWASASFYYSLLKAGVRIFEYNLCILHAKTLLLDDWAIVGTSNLNYRSLLHDLEVDVMIQSPASKKLLAQQFMGDLKQSKEINLQSLRQRRLYKRAIGRLILYMKYWI